MARTARVRQNGAWQEDRADGKVNIALGDNAAADMTGITYAIVGILASRLPLLSSPSLTNAS